MCADISFPGWLDPVDELAVLIAAMAHDVKVPTSRQLLASVCCAPDRCVALKVLVCAQHSGLTTRFVLETADPIVQQCTSGLLVVCLSYWLL